MAKPNTLPAKTRTKSGDPFNGANLTPGNPGNSGGKKGRSGRRPGWFREFAGTVLKDPEVQAAIRSRARNAKAMGFWDGVKTLGQAAGEIVKDALAVQGELTIHVVRDEPDA